MSRIATTSALAAVALVALGVTACAPVTGASGSVFVGPVEAGLNVFVIACRVDATGGCSTIDQFLVPGQTTGANVEYAYEFRLDKGTWIVGAFADKNDDLTITDDLVELDPSTAFVIDPEIEDQRIHTFDVWLGRNKDGRAGVRGNVRVGPRYQGEVFQVFLLDGALSNPDATIRKFAFVGPGTDLPFEFFNVLPGTYHLIAISDVGADEDPSNDVLAVSHQNPILASADVVVDNADIWVDRQAPGLGSISGTVTLNSALSGMRLQVAAYDADPARVENANVVAFADLAVPAVGNSTDFTIPSLPVTTLYLVSQVTLGKGEEARVAARVYRAPGSTEATPIRLTQSEMHATGVALNLGVGRVSGRITFNNPPATLALGAVLASFATDVVDLELVRTEVQTGAACGTAARCWIADYELFGLEDGTFDMSFVPDTSGDGWIQDELDQTVPVAYSGSPAKVTIAGGGREGCDFTVTRDP